MTRFLPCGSSAMLVETDGLDEAMALHETLIANPVSCNWSPPPGPYSSASTPTVRIGTASPT
jgi:hypothetical protein